MPKYKLKYMSGYRQGVKRMIKRGCDLSLLNEVVHKLSMGEQLPDKYLDHPLSGKWKGFRDCHILNDWVLIYKIDKDILTLILAETGTHSDVLE